MENSEVQKPDSPDTSPKPYSSNISLVLLAVFFIVVILALSFIYWKKIYPEEQSSEVYTPVSQESSPTSQTNTTETQTSNENETSETAFTPALIDTETEQAVFSSLADFDSIFSEFDSILKDLNSINTTQDNTPTL